MRKVQHSRNFSLDLKGGRVLVLVLRLCSREMMMEERWCWVGWPGWQGLLRWSWLDKGWSSFSSLSHLVCNHWSKTRSWVVKGHLENVPHGPEILLFQEIC